MSAPASAEFPLDGGRVLVVPLGPWMHDRLSLSVAAAEAMRRRLAVDAATSADPLALRAQVVRRDGGRHEVTIAANDIATDAEGCSLRLPLPLACDAEQRRGGRVEIWLQPPVRTGASQ